MDQDITAVIEEATELLTSFSIPLYVDDRRNRPELIATGFFVTAGPAVFLISAAHVFDAWAAGLHIYYYIRPGVIRYLTGKLVSSRGREHRRADIVDIGCLRLDGDNLPPYPDVSKSALDISHLAPRRVPRRGREYITIGFPATKSAFNDRDKTTLAAPYGYRSDSIGDDAYKSFGLAAETHIALAFDQRRGFDVLGRKSHFPKPQGMSGAPVFVLFEDAPGPPRVFPLVGVAIEHRKPEKLLVATDISFAIDAMAHAAGG